MALLKRGLHPKASEALAQIGITAGRITQTVGHAAASAGVHAADGTAGGEPYCAAIDLRARDLSQPEIKALLAKLGAAGFAAWYRNPGSDHWPVGPGYVIHVHAVYAGAPMKPVLQNQVHDYCHGRNGLRSRAPYAFWAADAATVETVRKLFLAHNPATPPVGLEGPEDPDSEPGPGDPDYHPVPDGDAEADETAPGS